VVKKKSELAIAGKGFANRQDQWRPAAPPFTFARQLSFQMLAKKTATLPFLRSGR
jgi:hypothetical protein